MSHGVMLAGEFQTVEEESEALLGGASSAMSVEGFDVVKWVGVGDAVEHNLNALHDRAEMPAQAGAWE